MKSYLWKKLLVACFVTIAIVLAHRCYIQFHAFPIFLRMQKPLPKELIQKMPELTNTTNISYINLVPYKCTAGGEITASDITKIRCVLAWHFLWPYFADRVEILDGTNIVAVCRSKGDHTPLIYFTRHNNNWMVEKISATVDDKANPN